jgi:hypothetical protein
MRRQSTLRVGLAAAIATTALTVGALAANAAEPAETYRGTYSAAAAADGLRVTMTLPAAPLSNTVADVGGPTAQAVLDSNGTSGAFASFPYPGANLAVAGGLVKGASNGQIPAPDYPFYVVAYNPTVPEQQVGSGPYTIRAESTGTSSQGTASAGVRSPGVGTLGLAEAKASTQLSSTVAGSASSHLTGLAIGPLEIGELFSSATTALGQDGKLDRKAETRIVAAKVGLTPVVIDSNGVSAGGTPGPAADTAGVHDALASAGITVKLFAAEETQTGIVAPVIRITQTQTQTGATLTYTIGGAAAFVQGTPAEDNSSAIDETLGGPTPAEATPAEGPPAEAPAPTIPEAVPAATSAEAAGFGADATFAGSSDSVASLPEDVGTLTVPDLSSMSGAAAGAGAAPGLGSTGDSGSVAAEAGGTSASIALASGYLVTRSNATPMLIALTALIAVAAAAALGVHLLSKEARS